MRLAAFAICLARRALGALGLFLGVALLLFSAEAAAQAAPPQELKAATRTGPGPGAAPKAVELPEYLEALAGESVTSAHYRLRWDWDAARTLPRRPALFFPGLIANVRLKVNGQPVLEMPADPVRSAPRGIKRIRLIELPAGVLRAGANDIELDVQAGKFTSVSRAYAAEYEALEPMYDARVLGRIVGPGIVSLLMGSLALVVLLLWARQRDPLYGYFGAGALAWSLHSAWTLLPFNVLSGMHFLVWWTSLFSFYCAMLTIFCIRFAGHHWRRFEQALWSVALAGPLLLYAAHGLNLFDTAREVWPFVWYAAVLVALWAVAGHAWRQRGATSALLLLCCAGSFGFAIHDWLAVHDPTDNAPIYLLPYAGLMFITLMGWMLSDRFVAASRRFAALNSELEQRVAEKSAELMGVLEQMRAARDSAQAANRAKSSFLAAASHDLRQPIHALGLYMSALQGDRLSVRQRVMLQNMSASHEALSSMFDALLDISRMDAGAVVPHRAPFALDRLLRRVRDDMLALTREKGLRLRVRLSPMLQERAASSDALLLERVIRNLMGNAIKYTVHGGVLLACRWRAPGAAWPQGAWQIEVWDTGIGIPEAEQERVFEEFYQIGNPHRERAAGLGLGLSIVRRLAGMLDLPLVLQSHPGLGTRFRLTVPATREAPPTDAPLAMLGQMTGLGVAVIDDDAEVRRAMSALLEGWGCRVFAGEHTEAVLQAAAEAPAASAAGARGAHFIDIIVADYQLREGRTGIEEIHALRAACGAELPAIIVSADSTRERLALIQASGFDYLSKPVSPPRLRSWLMHAVRADSTPWQAVRAEITP